VPESLVNTAHRGSYFLEKYELRITRRCLTEDFGEPAGTPIADLLDQEIVKALIKDRATTATGGKTVGPAAGENTYYRLGYGDDHRGATWWDSANKVVWLCAYHGRHRSGEPDDASKELFPRLITDEQMKPTADDYERLFEERDEWFDDHVLPDAQELLAQARSEPGKEYRRTVGGQAPVGCLFDVVSTLEETYIALFPLDLDFQQLLKILAAFFPDSRFEDWEPIEALPTRKLDLDQGEFGYRLLRG
jgi:hypothetical protein